MGSIPKEGIIALFQQMYAEHWRYEWGAAERGCVDCSGAFVYAYKQYNQKIAHGSNSIGHKYVGELLPISQAEPGMAAFKCKEWTEDDKGNSWYGKEPGNLSHIGLVDTDTGYVLNAKGVSYGFSRDALTAKNGWDFVARLDAVDYGGGGGGEKMTVTISGGNPEKPINMRASSTTQSKIIAEIPQGSTAELVREDGTWDKITYGGQTGYVKAEFVHKSEPEPSEDKVTVPREELEQIYDQLGNWLGLRG